MSPFSVMALCLVALAALHSAAALRCWSCDSQNDYACDDPFRTANRFALIECDNRAAQGPAYYHGYPVCRKVKQRIDGRPLVIRSCGWVDPNDGGRSACNQLSTPGYIHQEYCSICNSDACNSAPRPNVPAAIFAAPLAALAAWMRR
ncbi:uncharacterized protein LOC113212078 isoform X2 [Frankliniella occidentalis]|uniref:Uncharacterized protein LOC113212078 isoform X2 n=1 Tax=Frankliniella occidentalis TaxID=133901 RepID=A0A6J1T4B5_FRAOC|nr:uncharacterized protein LOC113212078 isoform X2 [Frankliniella occidentalis]